MIEQIEQFTADLQSQVEADPFFKDREAPTYHIDKNARSKQFIRIVMTQYDQPSVWGFIERDTGNILKAAGWSKPAKHSRGNIIDAEYGRNYTWTGPNYLR